MTIFADVQKFDVGDVVQLFDFDTTPIDDAGTVYYFTPSTYSAVYVKWRGNDYQPIDIQASGFERNANGALPRPKISVSGSTLKTPGVMNTLNLLLIANDNLRGARVTRWRTLKKYLDVVTGSSNETTSDINMYVQVDVFVVNQKTIHNKYNIEWELTAYVDYEGQKLPRRQMLKDFCTHIYRVWNGSSFDTNLSGKGSSCPYTGAAMFAADGSPVVAGHEEDDICGKKTSDCILRYVNSPLPTTAFPLISAVRVR